MICLLRGNSSFDRSSPNTNTAVPSRNQTRKLVIAARPSRKTGLEPRLSTRHKYSTGIHDYFPRTFARIKDPRLVPPQSCASVKSVTVQKLQFLIFTLSQLFYFLCVGCSFASADVGTWKMNWTCVEVHESLRSRSMLRINSTNSRVKNYHRYSQTDTANSLV